MEPKSVLSLLENTDPQALVEDDSLDWKTLSDDFGFTSVPPEKPAMPPEPQQPVVPKPPHEDDPKYTVELSTLDKLLSSRRVKKEQAALQRFERDRKRWNEDKLNAMAHYELAKKQYAHHLETSQAEYEVALEEWRRAFADHLRAA